MTVAEWFEDHKNIGFTVDHPKTRAGHKTNVEMWSMDSGVKVFRETVTYGKLTDMQMVTLLNDMYKEIKQIEVEMKRRLESM